MLLSGGIDSATSLYISRKRGYESLALTVLFHRIARGEVAAARRIAEDAGVEGHRFVRMPDLREVGDTGMSEAFPGLPPTYIPLRNMVFYGVAASVAEEVGADCIVGGHNADDARVFPDTSATFFRHLQDAMWSASRKLRERRTTILRPLQLMTKAEVVGLANRLGVPLGLTWSCHREGDEHCWRCDGCRGRVEAFRGAGVRDPLRGARSPRKV